MTVNELRELLANIPGAVLVVIETEGAAGVLYPVVSAAQETLTEFTTPHDDLIGATVLVLS